MTVDVVTSMEIACSRFTVAEYASDPDHATAWYKNIKSVEWRTPKPVTAGTKVAFVATFLGRHLNYVYEVREVAEGERFVMSTDEGPFPMETTYTWRDSRSGGTHMELRNRGEPSGFFKIVSPIVAAAMRRANRQDLARLRAILEPSGRT